MFTDDAIFKAAFKCLQVLCSGEAQRANLYDMTGRFVMAMARKPGKVTARKVGLETLHLVDGMRAEGLYMEEVPALKQAFDALYFQLVGEHFQKLCAYCRWPLEGEEPAPNGWSHERCFVEAIYGCVYTLGKTSGYDKDLRERPRVVKCGREETPDPDTGEVYGGGWVWLDPEQARAFAWSEEFARAFPPPRWQPREFSVYELALPATLQECMTELPEADGVHRLLRDAHILGKVHDLQGDVPPAQVSGLQEFREKLKAMGYQPGLFSWWDSANALRIRCGVTAQQAESVLRELFGEAAANDRG